MNPLDVMWTEKYRPKKIDDIVGDAKDKIREHMKNPARMQNLLLVSKTPGTGKTTMSKAIVNELGSDKLVLNSSDDRKIETVREKITDFVKTKSSKEGTRRVVIMDEADGLTPAAQDAMRNLMETYSSNALFILTCNKKSKILDALQSRCVTIEFSNPDKSDIAEYLTMICDKEDLDYTLEGVQAVIEKNYPSIRNCVQVLQAIKTEGKSVVPENVIVSDEEISLLWKMITVDKDWRSVKDYIFQNSVDIREVNKKFWYNAVEDNNVKIMQVTASNEDRFTRGGEEIVIFITSLLEMIK